MVSSMKLILQLMVILCVVGCGERTHLSHFEETKALAEDGDAKAQDWLGFYYQFGVEVEQDSKEAVKWYQKAAEQGLPKAQCSLGEMYHDGKGGVTKDYKKAVTLYRKAAEQGHYVGQLNLGLMYELGYGVKEDYVTAYAWYDLTAANDVEFGEAKVDIAKLMTPGEIAKAEELVKEMIKKNPKLIQKKK